MAYEHQALSDAELGPIAARMVGESAPPKMRRLVAQGAAPLPPRDMLLALYQVWVVEATGELGELAGKTIATLPENTLKGAISDPQIPAGVLDLLGRKLVRNDELLDAVVRHKNIDDQSLIGIARVCGAIVCETIARSEARWLRTPQIVASLYQNRHCRMSLIHRMLEMAEREGVEIKMAGIEEVRAAMRQDEESGEEISDEERDAAFAAAMSVDDEESEAALDDFIDGGVDDDMLLPEMDEGELEASLEPEEEPEQLTRLQELMAMRPPAKVRAALLGDKSDRAVLIRDSNKVVAMSAVKSPKVTDSEAVSWSANRSLAPEIIRYIANRREWIKLYTVKFNLVMNPKTPMSKSMTLLAYLNRGDLAKVARSKGIPSALNKAAKRKLGNER